MATTISDNTTLGELEAEAGKQGVTFISVKIAPGSQVIAGLQVNFGEHFIVGHGATIGEAICKAFEALRAGVAGRLNQ